MLVADASAAAAWRRRRAALDTLGPAERADALRMTAVQLRHDVLDMIAAAGQGHIGGDFSVVDLLTVLFERILRIAPERPLDRTRDIFILSKGHAAASLYATLANTGFYAKAELGTFMQPLSPLNGHPAKPAVPGVETSTGPLGHGLPVAVGAALGRRLSGADSRVFVVTGDGELQEGSNWEAIMSAAHFRLANLTLVVDRNRLQQGDRTEATNALDPLDEKLRAFQWEVRVVDGHDHIALEEALAPSSADRPLAIVANTVKGRGVSFIEDRAEWHHRVPTASQVEDARRELV